MSDCIYRPRLLELFAGSQELSKVAAQLGFDVVTLDINPMNNPTICVDILNFNYKDLRFGIFDYIHASPPCEEFSMLKTKGTRDLDKAKAIGERCREIINYHCKVNKNCLFTIENPESSLIQSESTIVGGLACEVASYCCYGYPYRKNTRFWHNLDHLTLKRCPDHCFWNKSHPINVQESPVEMRSKIPACLCLELLLQASQQKRTSWTYKFTYSSGNSKGLALPKTRSKKHDTDKDSSSSKNFKDEVNEEVYCHNCHTYNSRRFYHVRSSTLPTLCVACYRRK